MVSRGFKSRELGLFQSFMASTYRVFAVSPALVQIELWAVNNRVDIFRAIHSTTFLLSADYVLEWGQLQQDLVPSSRHQQAD